MNLQGAIMSQTLIFGPMGALAALTFLVLLIIPVRRFRASFSGQVGPGDFKLGESANVPEKVSLPNRNMMNLLEMPLLFYVVCMMYFVSGTVTHNALWLAWLYVGLRVLHSAIHITYNNVMHRLTMFALSNFALIALWLFFFFPPEM